MGGRDLGEAGLGVNVVLDPERWQLGPRAPCSPQRDLLKDGRQYPSRAMAAKSCVPHCRAMKTVLTRGGVLMLSQEPQKTQPREESMVRIWGNAGEGRVAPPAAQENSGVRPSPTMLLRPHQEAWGQTEAGREGQGKELHGASLCGHEQAIKKPEQRSGWSGWASGRLTWLWRT